MKFRLWRCGARRRRRAVAGDRDLRARARQRYLLQRRRRHGCARRKRQQARERASRHSVASTLQDQMLPHPDRIFRRNYTSDWIV